MSGRTLHAPGNVLRYLLIAKGHGTAPSSSGLWPIFHGKEPDLPDDAVTVYTTPGIGEGCSMLDGILLVNQGVQIRVRSADEEEGWAKISSIADECDRIVQEILSVTTNVGTAQYKIQCVTRSGRGGTSSGSIIAAGQNVPAVLGQTAAASKRFAHFFNGSISIQQLS